MYVLGIETSCDETSAAIVKDGRDILSNITVSSLSLHKKYGGVIPEIAFRMHLESIIRVTDLALEKAGIQRKDLALVSVTEKPGLLGALLVGVSFAKAVSLALGIPLIGVDHVNSHIYACFMSRPGARVNAPTVKGPGTKLDLPCVSLVVSGGHTSLFYMENYDKISLLGATQDDACGEAFDKVAKILGLGYPGGPLIERIARDGDPAKIRFGCSVTKGPMDFSFSGIKTAVLYKARGRTLSLQEKKDIAASFQEIVIDTLVRKALVACGIKRAKTLMLGGGVVANQRLRAKFLQAVKKAKIKLFFPPVDLCMDNAAMVAGLGYQLFKIGHRSELTLSPGA